MKMSKKRRGVGRRSGVTEQEGPCEDQDEEEQQEEMEEEEVLKLLVLAAMQLIMTMVLSLLLLLNGSYFRCRRGGRGGRTNRRFGFYFMTTTTHFQLFFSVFDAIGIVTTVLRGDRLQLFCSTFLDAVEPVLHIVLVHRTELQGLAFIGNFQDVGIQHHGDIRLADLEGKRRRRKKEGDEEMM
jgi:hypothetical protein